MRITSKGQVTIPADIRARAGFLPNTEVEILMSGNEVVIHKTRKSSARGQKLIKALRGAGTVNMTTDQIMSLTRGD